MTDPDDPALPSNPLRTLPGPPARTSIRIVPPDPRWAARFHALAAAIRPHMPPGAALQHTDCRLFP
ncbi:hypothetical protein [Deinococcus knuensis]|uniref:Uncharacterized protein n=1 Tax=Deinococcus knuensis TaxID=1837380 RepID=A0ABQ2SD67_9DEIO|nr:hypothetical protein [Deinococcus knuensis]GGS19798.1 hypothetical protein GCM10008961_09230 [Deinococcus knuensis]